LPPRAEWGLGEFEALIATADRDAWREQLNACVSEGRQIGLELRMINADGYTRWLSLRGMRLDQPHPHQLFGVLLDITDSKQAQETILFQASHDSLTGLINRVLLFDRLGQEVRRCQRTDGHFAVLFIDLDFFKVINDRYGHEAGDRVLVQVGKRLVSALRKSDTVGRFGGDEFIAIIPGVDSRELVSHMIRKILRRLETPILFGREELFISASVGVSLYPNDATLPQELIRKADNDMYLVKEQRRILPDKNGKKHTR
jgi:diguanylate cyclase (GGDEF)-like protein